MLTDDIKNLFVDAKKLSDSLNEISMDIKTVEKSLKDSGINFIFNFPLSVNHHLSWDMCVKQKKFRLLYMNLVADKWIIKPLIECDANTRVYVSKYLSEFLKEFRKEIERLNLYYEQRQYK